jgi:hypothetical protein
LEVVRSVLELPVDETSESASFHVPRRQAFVFTENSPRLPGSCREGDAIPFGGIARQILKAFSGSESAATQYGATASMSVTVSGTRMLLVSPRRFLI